MASQPFSRRYIIREYWPNQPAGRVREGTCIIGENILFGIDGFSRLYGGSAQLSEINGPVSPAYLANTNPATDVVTLTGGATAIADIAPYQHIMIDGLLYCVRKVISDTAIAVTPNPATLSVNEQIWFLPNLHGITRQKPERASLYAGNAVRYREEAIFAVGRGALKIGGAPLVNSLVASSTPQVAYPIPGGTYDVRPVGFTRAAAVGLLPAGGGTKGMPAGKYSIRVSKKRKGFPGYGLASPATITTIVAGQQLSLQLPPLDPAEGQTSFIVWASSTEDLITGGSAWFMLGEYNYSAVPINIEYTDGELGLLYVDDNFPPPPSSYVITANDRLIFAGWGDAPDASGNPTSPGPGIAVSKSNNPEAFSPDAYAFITPAEEIVGVKTGKPSVRVSDSMVYFMSMSALNIGRFTDETPSRFTCSPYALAGFTHQYSGCVAYDFFYGLAPTSRRNSPSLSRRISNRL